MPVESTQLETPALGLYVHLPWCVRKCPYCDFNSHEAGESIPADAYSTCLVEDLEQDLPLVWGRKVSTIYFGGGTPSLFTAAQIDGLISAFRARLEIAPDAEITLEANPGTVERDSFRAYREAGVNRVSLGAQSFSDSCLSAIGRIHGRDDLSTAIKSLRSAGMDSFNLDLMFGLPGQDEEGALSDISQAAQTGAGHLSHYQLTLEPNTAFFANPPALPGDDCTWQMQVSAAHYLAKQGFRQYEISAWAHPGSECRHNLNYWRYGDFLGIGAGAHAKISNPADNSIRRLSKSRHPRRYMNDDRVATDRCIDDAEKSFEFFLNCLRLSEGFTPGQFARATGLSWTAVEEKVDLAQQKGLLQERDGRFTHTETGWRFINDIQALFLPKPNT